MLRVIWDYVRLLPAKMMRQLWKEKMRTLRTPSLLHNAFLQTYSGDQGIWFRVSFQILGQDAGRVRRLQRSNQPEENEL